MRPTPVRHLPLLAILLALCPACAVGTADVWAADSATPQPLDSANYRILSVNSGMALDVTNGSTANGAFLQQWPFWNGPMQLWHLNDAGGGTFSIANVNSGKVADVAGVSTAPNAAIIQWDNWNGPGQRWRPVQQADGTFQLVSLNTGMCLDVVGISKTAGARLQQFTCWGSPNQAWKIEAMDAAGNPTGTWQPNATGTPSTPASTGNPGKFILATSLRVLNGSAPTVACADPNRQAGEQSVAPAAGTSFAIPVSGAAGTSLALGLRVSAPNTDVTAHVLVNGQNVTGALLLPTTGANTSYQTINVRNVLLGSTNDVRVVFDTAGALLHGVLVLPTTSVQLIEHPAQVFFGGLTRNADLLQANAWPWVRAHVDGFTFHSAAWGQQDMGTANQLVQLMPPTARFTGELGALGPEDVPVPGDVGTGRGNQWGSWAQMMRDQGHVPMHHLYMNVIADLFFLSMARTTPQWPGPQINQAALQQQLAYEAAIHAAVPGMPLGMIFANPVFTTWKGQAAIAYDGRGGMNFSPLTDTAGNTVLVNGNPVNFNFDSFDFLQPYFQQAQFSYGYETDSPSNYMTFYGPENDPRNVAYRHKIVSYERWLHGMNLPHTQIVNSDAQGGSATNGMTQDQWDQAYYGVCTQGIALYQRSGGRADIYNAESWYSGPYTMIPETQPYTYTNLVWHLLQYLKGPDYGMRLTAPDGSTSKTLQVPLNGHATQTLTLLNQGQVEALPLIAASESGNPGVGVVYQDATGNDVTQAVAHTGGYTPGATLAAQGTQSLQVAVTCPNYATTRTLNVAAFWNPQDPQRTARASFALTVRCGS